MQRELVILRIVVQVFLGGSLIAWKTKEQTAISCSSAEAKLRALSLLTAEVTFLRWLLRLLRDFCVSVTTPTTLLSTVHVLSGLRVTL